ncbi:MAG: DegT/DnrJ/EryC1/StrS family aminotransferase [Spirochaetales bacterium]|nr:DegT/DnrJ/EryC1/StrS family aminotransferase [Spirochaetales bacterium]
MEFVDLKKQYLEYKVEIDTEIKSVLDNCQFINGPAVKELETDLSAFCGAEHSIACSSGTDALTLAMMALDVKPGDEIIVPAFTFIATASMVSFLGAVPVFCDVDPVTFNIDPKLIKDKITSKTRGIIAVSLYGQTADFDIINSVAEENNLWVIEDAAQSFGAEYKGKKSCNLTKISTTSFFPAKPLGCYGDGGAVFTNDDELNERIRIVVNHGQEKRYFHKYIGVNGRMDTLQAAVVKVKLKYFSDEIKKRNSVAEKYTELLESFVKTPVVLSENKSVWAQYTIRTEKRDKIIDSLSAKGIPSAIHYPMPLPRQEAFSYLGQPVDFTVSDNLSIEVMSLPMHPFLETNDIETVCSAIKVAL